MNEGTAKSQSSLEIIILTGVIFILIIPLFFVSTSRLEGSRESNLDQNAEAARTGVDQLLSLGEGSSKTIVVNNPSGIEWADVIGNEIQVGWQGNVLHWRMQMNMSGNWPASEGLHEVRLFNAGNVIIVISCGNNVREGFEQCDGSDDDLCPLSKAPPTFPPIEICGNPSTADACQCLCVSNANCPPGYACVNGACEKAGCGDGVLQTGEECDLGNLNNPPGVIGGSGCACDEDDVTCTSSLPPISIGPLAGSGEVIDTFEGCRWPKCGDGIVNNLGTTSASATSVNYDGVPEQCDDGNTIPGDGCDAFCQFEPVTPLGCGNGIAEPGEECGEPGLPSCSPGQTCTNCLCNPTICNYDYECPTYPNQECLTGACVPVNECNKRVAQWNLDDPGPTTASDSIGSFDLTKTGTGTVNFAQPGLVCGAVQFTGTPAFLGRNVLATDGLNFDSGDDFSVEFLVKSSTTNQNPLIAGKYDYNWPIGASYIVGYTGNGINRIGSIITDINAASTSIEHPLNLGDGQWHHIVVVRLHTATGGKIVKMYIDGVPTPTTVDDLTGVIASNGIFAVGSPAGAVPTSMNPWTEFTGMMEGVVVYNTALSDTMVQTHYANAFANGVRYCGETCTPSSCGDGVAQWPNSAGQFEMCDGQDMRGETCATQGYAGGGTLSCNSDCTLNTNNCNPAPQVLCGNGIVNPPYEDCDRGNICIAYVPDSCNRAPGTAGATCSCPPGTPGCDVFGMSYPSGCVWPTCGDNVVNNWLTLASGEHTNYDLLAEQCDGLDMNGMSCTTFGFTGGTLACKPAGALGECSFDTSGCTGPLPTPLSSSPPPGHGGPGGGGGCAPISICPTCGTPVCGGSCPPERPVCQTHDDHCDCVPINLCGNGVLDQGEGCDPPGSTAVGGCAICQDGTILCGTVTCQSDCQWGPIVWPNCPGVGGIPGGGGNCGSDPSTCTPTGTGSGPCRDLIHAPGTTPAGKAPVCGGGCPNKGETCEPVGSSCECLETTKSAVADVAIGKEPSSGTSVTPTTTGNVWQALVNWLGGLFGDEGD